MKKINHAERVRKEPLRYDGLIGAGDSGIYFDTLFEKAAGLKESDDTLDQATEKILALNPTLDHDDVYNIIVDVLDPLRDHGFNVGFELGFGEGALLGAYGNAAPVKKTESRPAAEQN